MHTSIFFMLNYALVTLFVNMDSEILQELYIYTMYVLIEYYQHVVSF